MKKVVLILFKCRNLHSRGWAHSGEVEHSIYLHLKPDKMHMESTVNERGLKLTKFTYRGRSNA
jgi:creatinine amidohydrolase/Fe(II)-dependent formamide hydrolase-like protein